MRLKLRKKIFSLRDSYDIHDEWGNLVYFAKRKLLSLGDVVTLFDANKNEIAQVRRKVITLFPAYKVLFHSGQEVIMRQNFSLFRQSFTIIGVGDTNLLAQGHLFDYEYSISHPHFGKIATISKKFFAFSDSYGIEICEVNYVDVILACTIVINLVRQRKNEILIQQEEP